MSATMYHPFYNRTYPRRHPQTRARTVGNGGVRYAAPSGTIIESGPGQTQSVVTPDTTRAPAAKIIIENRPVQPGIYLMQVNLPQAMNAEQARNYFAQTVPPQNAEYYKLMNVRDFNVDADGKLLNYDEMMRLLDGLQSGQISDAYMEKVKESQDPLILGSGDSVTALGYFMFVKEEFSPPPGLSQHIQTSYYSAEGQLIKEVDAEGHEWTPDSTVSGFPALIVAIPGIITFLVSALFAVAVGYVVFKALKTGKEWVDYFFKKVGVETSTGLITVAAIGVGTVALFWLLSAMKKPKTTRKSKYRSE